MMLRKNIIQPNPPTRMMKVHPRWCLRSMIIQTPMWVFPKNRKTPQNGFSLNGKPCIKMDDLGVLTVPPFSETHHVLCQATRHVHCQLRYWPSTPHNLLDCPRPLVDSSSDFHLNHPQLFSETNLAHQAVQYGEKNHVKIYNIRYPLQKYVQTITQMLHVWILHLHSAKNGHIQGEMAG